MLYEIYDREGTWIGRSWGNSTDDALERADMRPSDGYALPLSETTNIYESSAGKEFLAKFNQSSMV